jgi:hypothetical protein
VFVGPFALDAVEAICAAPPLDPAATLDTLGDLVDRSLVEVEERRGETRYRLLETIRAYAAERLAVSGEGDAVRTRHRDWFAGIAERQIRSQFSQRQFGLLLGAAPANASLADDLANLRAAAECSLARGDDANASLRLAGMTGQLLFDMGHFPDAIELTSRALASRGRCEPEAVLTCLMTRGAGLMRTGDFAAGFDCYEEVAGEASSLPGYEYAVSVARSVQSIAAHASGKGDPEKLAKLAVESARACGYPQGESMGLSQLGATRLIAGRFSEAAEILDGLIDRFAGAAIRQDTIYSNAALVVVARVMAGDEAAAAQAYARLMTFAPPTREDPFTRSWLAWSVGRARALWFASTGDRAGADRALAEALEQQRRVPVPLADADYLVTAGAIAFFAGEPERAAGLLGAGRSAMDRYRSWRGHDAGPIYVTFRKRCEEALGSERMRALLREGRALPADDAIAQLRSALER